MRIALAVVALAMFLATMAMLLGLPICPA